VRLPTFKPNDIDYARLMREWELLDDRNKVLERENAALREAKDAYFRHNNILVELMTEEQKKKALEILLSRPKEVQP
jgi:hypothetical protein